MKKVPKLFSLITALAIIMSSISMSALATDTKDEQEVGVFVEYVEGINLAEENFVTAERSTTVN